MEMHFKILPYFYLSVLLSAVFLSIGGKKTLGIRRATIHLDESLTNIWPLPKQFTSGNHTITVDPDLTLDIQGSGDSSPIVLEAFERFRNLVFKKQFGYAWGEHDVSKLTVVVASDDDTLQLGVDESYTLYVSDGSDGRGGGGLLIVGGFLIEANTIYGALRGLETLSQLCTYNYNTKTVEVNKAPWYIYDEPRFSFRGLLLDSSRHFLPVNVIKKVIESMSYAKLNVLHWHIIDEDSFPLEVPTYPNLWEGSYTKWERYTVEDTLEIVDFAKRRGIHVMAELDVPGHSESWGVGYPDLWPSPNCKEPLDFTKEFTFDVISGILAAEKLMNPLGLLSAGGTINSAINFGFRRLFRARARSLRHCSNCCKTLITGKSEKLMAMSQTQDMVVRDCGLLYKKKAAIREAGPSKFQIIADFDGTLTKYWIEGRRGQSSHGLLQQGNPEYDAKREELYNYYHPLEYSPTIPIEEKTKFMEEWWEKTHGLLIEGGLTVDAIKKSVISSSISFRDGVVELFEFLEEKGVPVLIFSAGLADIIEEVFRQKLHRSFKNIKIVSNRMVFDDNGQLVSFKGKTIHVLNKNEHALARAVPVHDQRGDLNRLNNENNSVKKRTNVLLLGDHIGDLGMSDGLNYENRIAVGFLYFFFPGMTI